MASSSSSTTAPPNRPNKAARARFAKETINKTIPHILATNNRARHGAENSELIFYSQPSSKKNKFDTTTSQPLISRPGEALVVERPDEKSGDKPAKVESKAPRIRVIQSDTYDAAESMLNSQIGPDGRTAILNMASALQPGGGVLNGAMAQEESLCVRSTLYASLLPKFYRTPINAVIYTPDVLVFRSSANNDDMPKAEWYYIDVISCAATKGPDLVKNEKGDLVYESGDYESMLMKIRLIFQIAKEKGVKRLVLGALGCGAYRNPPREVAKLFRKVVLGDRKRVGIEGIDEIVFAIFDDGENLSVFRDAFKDVVER